MKGLKYSHINVPDNCSLYHRFCLHDTGNMSRIFSGMKMEGRGEVLLCFIINEKKYFIENQSIMFVILFRSTHETILIVITSNNALETIQLTKQNKFERCLKYGFCDSKDNNVMRCLQSSSRQQNNHSNRRQFIPIEDLKYNNNDAYDKQLIMNMGGPSHDRHWKYPRMLSICGTLNTVSRVLSIRGTVNSVSRIVENTLKLQEIMSQIIENIFKCEYYKKTVRKYPSQNSINQETICRRSNPVALSGKAVTYLVISKSTTANNEDLINGKRPLKTKLVEVRTNIYMINLNRKYSSEFNYKFYIKDRFKMSDAIVKEEDHRNSWKSRCVPARISSSSIDACNIFPHKTGDVNDMTPTRLLKQQKSELGEHKLKLDQGKLLFDHKLKLDQGKLLIFEHKLDHGKLLIFEHKLDQGKLLIFEHKLDQAKLLIFEHKLDQAKLLIFEVKHSSFLIQYKEISFQICHPDHRRHHNKTDPLTDVLGFVKVNVNVKEHNNFKRSAKNQSQKIYVYGYRLHTDVSVPISPSQKDHAYIRKQSYDKIPETSQSNVDMEELSIIPIWGISPEKCYLPLWHFPPLRSCTYCAIVAACIVYSGRHGNKYLATLLSKKKIDAEITTCQNKEFYGKHRTRLVDCSSTFFTNVEMKIQYFCELFQSNLNYWLQIVFTFKVSKLFIQGTPVLPSDTSVNHDVVAVRQVLYNAQTKSSIAEVKKTICTCKYGFNPKQLVFLANNFRSGGGQSLIPLLLTQKYLLTCVDNDTQLLTKYYVIESTRVNTFDIIESTRVNTFDIIESTRVNTFVIMNILLTRLTSSTQEISHVYDMSLTYFNCIWITLTKFCLVDLEVKRDRNNCNGEDDNLEDLNSDDPQQPKSSSTVSDCNTTIWESFECEIMCSPTVLSATDRVYDLQSGRQIRQQSAGNLDPCSSTFSSQDHVDTDTCQFNHFDISDRNDLLVSASEILASSSADMLSTTMNNAGLSEADLRAFISSDAAIESFLWRNGISTGHSSHANEPDFLYSLFGTLDSNSIYQDDNEYDSCKYNSTPETSLTSQSEKEKDLWSMEPKCAKNTSELQVIRHLRGQQSSNLTSSSLDFYNDSCSFGWDEYEKYVSCMEQENCTSTALTCDRNIDNVVGSHNRVDYMENPQMSACVDHLISCRSFNEDNRNYWYENGRHQQFSPSYQPGMDEDENLNTFSPDLNIMFDALELLPTIQNDLNQEHLLLTNIDAELGPETSSYIHSCIMPGDSIQKNSLLNPINMNDACSGEVPFAGSMFSKCDATNGACLVRELRHSTPCKTKRKSNIADFTVKDAVSIEKKSRTRSIRKDSLISRPTTQRRQSARRSHVKKYNLRSGQTLRQRLKHL